MSYEEAIDRTFDRGHSECQDGQTVTLTMCAPCAEFITRTLAVAAEIVADDPRLRYYMKAFEADLIVQILKQTSPEPDFSAL